MHNAGQDKLLSITILDLIVYVIVESPLMSDLI